ncbi:hypothetical protein LT85_4903 [Collimonas arenae]|uniref:Transmembrane protein n=1 Tax=Collimonas arenae TaxID=279058 RepID=A0A0A1FHK2_9BURK|nr:hypothetical protein [Collimonas arenae]AIY44061.1 hypothetical protein LT85_4903 [Collimonas arenae]
MSRHAGLDSHLSTAERKQKLLAEGAVFRAEMLHSRDIVRANLNSKSLATIVLGRVSGIASSLLGTSSALKASNLPAMLPLVVTGVSWLSKRCTRKPFLIGAAVIAAIGGAVFVSSRNSKETTDDE